MPAHSGGGRQADYCSRSCQGKAYRVRHAHGTARDDSQWSALTARAVAAETEAVSLRKQLAAVQRRVDKLTAELAVRPVTKDTAGARQEPAVVAVAPTGSPTLPPPIRAARGARRYEQTGTSAWAVYVNDVPVGDIKLLSGKHWATLPNGFEIRSGTKDLDDAAHELVLAYNGWSNYWHAETAARLTLLRPQQDGARTVRWGGTSIGKVGPAAAVGLGGKGVVAITPRAGTLGTRGHGTTMFASEQEAADALLKRYQAEHTPPWGDLVR